MKTTFDAITVSNLLADMPIPQAILDECRGNDSYNVAHAFGVLDWAIKELVKEIENNYFDIDSVEVESLLKSYKERRDVSSNGTLKNIWLDAALEMFHKWAASQ